LFSPHILSAPLSFFVNLLDADALKAVIYFFPFFPFFFAFFDRLLSPFRDIPLCFAIISSFSQV
jgi:hypothetical protein